MAYLVPKKVLSHDSSHKTYLISTRWIWFVWRQSDSCHSLQVSQMLHHKTLPTAVFPSTVIEVSQRNACVHFECKPLVASVPAITLYAPQVSLLKSSAQVHCVFICAHVPFPSVFTSKSQQHKQCQQSPCTFWWDKIAWCDLGMLPLLNGFNCPPTLHLQKRHAHTCAVSSVTQMRLGCPVLDFPPSPSSPPMNRQELKDRSSHSGLDPKMTNPPVQGARATAGNHNSNMWWQRVQFKCAQRAVLATSNLFIKPDFSTAWEFCAGDTSKTWQIFAQMTLCPAKNNNYIHQITWDATNTAGLEPQWLQIPMPSNEQHKGKNWHAAKFCDIVFWKDPPDSNKRVAEDPCTPHQRNRETAGMILPTVVRAAAAAESQACGWSMASSAISLCTNPSHCASVEGKSTSIHDTQQIFIQHSQEEARDTLDESESNSEGEEPSQLETNPNVRLRSSDPLVKETVTGIKERKKFSNGLGLWINQWTVVVCTTKLVHYDGSTTKWSPFQGQTCSQLKNLVAKDWREWSLV